MFLKFADAADLESWARGYRLAVTTTAEETMVAGTGGHISQHSDELLAVTITCRWVSCRNKLVTAGGEVVQDGGVSPNPRKFRHPSSQLGLHRDQ